MVRHPPSPHSLSKASELGRHSWAGIRITSPCNPNASDTKPDETKNDPEATVEAVGSSELKKEEIDLGQKRGNTDREKIALQMGTIAAKQHSHKLEAALKQAQADRPDADADDLKVSPMYDEQRSAATKELTDKELPALETLLALQDEDNPAMVRMEESGM